MSGRGALADPLLFTRLRGEVIEYPTTEVRSVQVQCYIGELLPGYLEQFCGERQALMKLKDLLNFILNAGRPRVLGRMKRAQNLEKSGKLLQEL